MRAPQIEQTIREAAMEFEDIQVTIEGCIGILSLHRPERSNAVRPTTLREICMGMDALSANPSVKAVIIRGEGKHFCSGADFSFLDRLTQMTPVEIQSEIYTHFQGAARRIYACSKPTIALVTGAAVTVGCELALACDFRLVAGNAKFQESWIKLGLLPPLGGLFLLPRLIGLGRAAKMVLLGEVVSGASAVEIGLASELLAEDQLEIRGRTLAAELSKLPPLAYGAIKQGLHRGMESSMENEWSANVLGQAVLLSTKDFREGLAAVKERRPGEFAGH
jgi:enoyl-CoA hydratase/carnithine racemase